VNWPEGVVAVLFTIETHWEFTGFRKDRFTELLAVKADPFRVIA
jgi:hypothetical protein